MKRILSVFLMIALVLTGLTLTSCGSKKKDMIFINVTELDSVDDEETKELLKNLTLMPKIEDYNCICILTEDAEGDIEIPHMYQGAFVAMVTAYPGACDNITSIKFDYALDYIENVCSFDSDDPSLKSIEFHYDWKPTVVNSFNHCSSLKDVEFPPNVSDLHAVFINDSFNSCKSLQSVDFKNAAGVTMDSSFCDCPALQDIYLDSFSDVKGSFNNCTAMEKLTMNGEISSVRDSFNDCASLSDIEIEKKPQDLTESFKNCPVDIADIKTKDEIAREEEEEQAQKEKEEQEKLERSVPYHQDDIMSLIDGSWEKLVSDGTIPRYEKDENERREIEFESAGNEIDKPKFSDADAGERLTSEPDVKLDKVAVVTFDTHEGSEKTILSMNSNNEVLPISESSGDSLLSDKDKKKIGSHLTSDYTECRYIITYEGFISNIKDDYYQQYTRYNNGPKIPSGYVDRRDVTTLVYIIDKKSGKIVHIHAVGTDIPADDGSDGSTGKVLKDEANEYICSLLK